MLIDANGALVITFISFSRHDVSVSDVLASCVADHDTGVVDKCVSW